MKQYAFIDGNATVVNVISGTLTPQQQAQFLGDYATLFHAVSVVEVESDVSIHLGGLYVNGVFEPVPAQDIADTIAP